MTRRIGIAGLAFPAGTPLREQAVAIRRHGFLRLDPRAAPGEADPLAPPAELRALRRMLADEGVAAGCLYGYPGAGPDHLRRLMDAAVEIGADQVRVLPGALPPGACGDLLGAALAARDGGPLLAVQNHPRESLPLADLLAVVRAIAHPRLRLACSPEHAWAAGGWDPAVAPWSALWLWCDATPAAGGVWRPVLPGTGSVPWAEIAPLVDPAAAISCKWEHRWHPELPGPQEALPAFAAHLGRHLG